MNNNPQKLLDCGHLPTLINGPGAGYGINPDNKTMCYDCCAEADTKQMLSDGRITLYLDQAKTSDGYSKTESSNSGTRLKARLTNWPGTLSIPVTHIKKGRHNWAGCRYDVWFTFQDKQWHGVQYGDNTQLCHCKQLKD